VKKKILTVPKFVWQKRVRSEEEEREKMQNTKRAKGGARERLLVR
jgi:hypothetical protein